MFNLAGYLIFALVTSITPGPNNYLLFNHGKSHGLKKSLLLMSGIFAGFFVLLYIAGYGIAGIILQNKLIDVVLKTAGSLWLFYLGFQMLSFNNSKTTEDESKFGFVQGFLLQFVNPKAWIMAVGGASAFLPKFESIHLNVFLLAITFSVVGIPCMIIWVLAGDYISKMLSSEKSNKILGWILFLLMLFSIITIWL